MRYFLLFLLVPFVAFANDYQVKPHSRSGNVAVKPHLKSSPDSTRMNNRSYKPRTTSSYKKR